MLRVVVLQVLFFVDAGDLPRIQCPLICCLKLFLRGVGADQLIRCVIIDYLTWFDGLHLHCDM